MSGLSERALCVLETMASNHRLRLLGRDCNASNGRLEVALLV